MIYERLNKADSYQGELLGVVAIHLLTTFAADFYLVPVCLGDILCDNKGALNQAAFNRNRVHVSAKHADLFRSL